MERPDPIRFWQAIVFASVDHELRRRPFVHKIRRVELVQNLLRVVIPGASSPLMIELRMVSIQEHQVLEMRNVQRRARPWSSHCTSHRIRHHGKPRP